MRLYIVIAAIITHSTLCGMEQDTKTSCLPYYAETHPRQANTNNTDTIKTHMVDKYKESMHTYIDQQKQYTTYNIMLNTITCIASLAGLSFTLMTQCPTSISLFCVGGAAAVSSMYVIYKQMHTLKNMKNYRSTSTTRLQHNMQAAIKNLEQLEQTIDAAMADDLEQLYKENETLRERLHQNANKS